MSEKSEIRGAQHVASVFTEGPYAGQTDYHGCPACAAVLAKGCPADVERLAWSQGIACDHASAMTAAVAAEADPFVAWLAKVPVGPPLSAEARRRLEEGKAHIAAGKHGVPHEAVLLACALRWLDGKMDPAIGPVSADMRKGLDFVVDAITRANAYIRKMPRPTRAQVPPAPAAAEPTVGERRCQGCRDPIRDGSPYSERVDDGCPFCPSCASENAASEDPDEMRAGEWAAPVVKTSELHQELRHLREQRDYLQAKGTALLERARKAEAAASRPKVGVSVLVRRSDGRILLGQRKGAHGAGTWSTPGGHLETGESVAECAARELLEETGIAVDVAKVKVLTEWTHDREPAAWGTYVTLWCAVDVPDGTEATVVEPDKCDGWTWVGWGEGWPGPLFRCFASLFHVMYSNIFGRPHTAS